jgi:integrase
MESNMETEPEAPLAAPVAPKFDKSSVMKDGKFDDRKLLKVNLPTREQRQFYASELMEDGLSLRIVIGFGGTKKWSAATYDERGKSVQTAIGTFPNLSCKQARDKARELFKDPQRRVREKEAGTFGEVSRKWFAAEIEGRGLRSEGEIQRRLNKYVLPSWEHRPFASIHKADVSKLLDKVQEQAREGPRKSRGAVQADGVLSTLHAIFVYQANYMHDSWVPPISKKMKRSEKKKRQRKLDDTELKQVWTESKTEASGEFGRFIRFLVLIPCRRSKVLAMDWTDVHGDTWFIPKQNREKGAPSFIRFPKLALDLIEEQRALRRNSSNRIWHCVALSRHKREFDKRVNATRQQAGEPDMPQWQLHDLRRTNRSRMSKIKDAEGRPAILPHIAEAALGHTLKVTDVQDTYDVNDYSDEESDAIALVANHIAKVVGENVVELPTKKDAA